MKHLDILKKALYEAEEQDSILQKTIQVQSDSSNLIFTGTMRYAGDSKIKLDLNIEMSPVHKEYSSEKAFDEISEDQFEEAAEKIQSALEKVSSEFSLALNNKLASYGLIEGDNHG